MNCWNNETLSIPRSLLRDQSLLLPVVEVGISVMEVAVEFLAMTLKLRAQGKMEPPNPKTNRQRKNGSILTSKDPIRRLKNGALSCSLIGLYRFGQNHLGILHRMKLVLIVWPPVAKPPCIICSFFSLSLSIYILKVLNCSEYQAFFSSVVHL